MPDPTAAELEELRRLEREATPGPWDTYRIDSDTFCAIDVIATKGDDPHPPVVVFLEHEDYSEGCANEGDHDLIVAMRNALPALLDAAEQNERRGRLLADGLVAVERAIAVLDEVPPRLIEQDGYYDRATSALLEAKKELEG